MNRHEFSQEIAARLRQEWQIAPGEATPEKLHDALSRTVMDALCEDWRESERKKNAARRACYFSAEFLVGRLVYNNLLCLGLLQEADAVLREWGASLSAFEEIEDAALGNGGLGRLAACFLDSAATLNLPLDGYGIRYRYGLFRQTLEDGYQREYADNWTKYGDAWSIRREEETVQVRFADQTVNAVPYDMPIIGYGTKFIGRLRLWQAEPMEEFSFSLFNDQKYNEAVEEKNRAEDISRVLYPNDSTEEGKTLRFKQQYFFSSASLQSMVREYKRNHGGDFSAFADWYAVQLNDTHPVVSIPELIRILVDEEGMSFLEAFSVAQRVFSYTNHTIMAEALETWSAKLIQSVCPRVMEIVRLLGEHLERELAHKKIAAKDRRVYRIIQGGMVRMAPLAIYVGHAINGVAELHTEIIKHRALGEWYALYPERFQNKTNGITQRRWLVLCNPALSALVSKLLGSDEWIRDLSKLKGLAWFADDKAVLEEFIAIKQANKQRLCDYLKKQEGVDLNPAFIFDIQVKRLHEYKRQLLNALVILDTYWGVKEGRIKGFTPTAYIFGAKAAPGYLRAKAIIHFICEIAKLIDSDSEMRDKMKVVFVQNYNVSYAERLVCAADLSEQISTAGTEASGTSNMKFMLNGTVTLGTFDGANVEIVREAGEENNYIFGARVEKLDEIRESYDPKKLYESEPRIKRALDTLIDGTFADSGNGEFLELHQSILQGASWHRPDHYFLLQDFLSYAQTRERAGRDYGDKLAFAKKCWMNLSHAGGFSSDRTIGQYADEIWNIKPL